ncbi:MAG TPA: decarboxylase, partial [Blastocatellia bacterium]|nr:decarboxylase [Blastocatellia bacterium]
VTFRFVPPEATESEVNEIHRRMVEAMVTDGFVFANSTALRGQTVMRLCTINPRTTTEDIHATIQKLDQLARTATNQVKNV